MKSDQKSIQENKKHYKFAGSNYFQKGLIMDENFPRLLEISKRGFVNEWKQIS